VEAELIGRSPQAALLKRLLADSGVTTKASTLAELCDRYNNLGEPTDFEVAGKALLAIEQAHDLREVRRRSLSKFKAANLLDLHAWVQFILPPRSALDKYEQFCNALRSTHNYNKPMHQLHYRETNPTHHVVTRTRHGVFTQIAPNLGEDRLSIG
jgi:hypothetical protein